MLELFEGVQRECEALLPVLAGPGLFTVYCLLFTGDYVQTRDIVSLSSIQFFSLSALISAHPRHTAQQQNVERIDTFRVSPRVPDGASGGAARRGGRPLARDDSWCKQMLMCI